MRVTIVGAGIIGLSIAWELSRRGASVRVIERGAAGRETSWAAAGILPAARRDTATDPLERFRGLSHELYPSWVNSLEANSNIDSGLRRCGGLYLASSIGEAATLVANVEYQRDLKIDATLLTRDQLATDEPALAEWANSIQFRAAVLSSDECQIRPPDLLAALLTACRASGVRIDEFTEAELRIHDAHAAVQMLGSSIPGTLAESDFVVVCGGAWAGQVANHVGLANSVIPVRGQMLLYNFSTPPLRRIVNEGHRYLVPRADGRLLVGSCEEEVGFQKGTTAEVLEPLIRWAESVLPAIVGRRPEKSWSALRPGTIDGFPMIGRVPKVANLFLAAGHYRSGIHLAPATAMVIADMIFGQPPAVDLAAFDVGRMVQATDFNGEYTKT